MLEPIKIAFGKYMSAFYATIVPTTAPLNEFIARGFPYSMAWASTFMVDEVEQMLAAWQRNDTYGTSTKSAKLPVICGAMARDYIPTSREYTRQIANSQEVVIPGDSKNRVFGLRTVAGDIRTQIAFIAAEEPTAKSLASQFLLFLDAVPNRRFVAQFTFAGVTVPWPVQIETPEIPAANVKSEALNTCILVVDLVLHAEIPLYDAPAPGAPNDGNGTPGTSDPAGYPIIKEIGINTPEKTFQSIDVPNRFFGINTGLGADISFGDGHAIITIPYPAISQYGFGLVRSWDNGFIWAYQNPSAGVYDWTIMDQWVAAYAPHCDLIYTVGMTPAWASANPSAPSPYGNGLSAPPSDMSTLADFITAVVQRYGTQIKYYEVWNEPNGGQSGFYSGTVSQLAEMVRTVNQAVKAVNQDALIISPPLVGWAPGQSPSLYNADTYFVDMMAASDAAGGTMAQWVDVIGQHFYSQDGDRYQYIANAKQSMIAANVGTLPLIDTENGISDPTGVSDATVFTELMRIYLTDAVNGLIGSCYYQLGNPTGDNGNAQYALLNRPEVLTQLTSMISLINRHGLANPQFNANTGAITVEINKTSYTF